MISLSISHVFLGVVTAFTLAPFMYILRKYVRQYSLRKIPGPPSPSWLKGKPNSARATCSNLIHFYLPGNYMQLHGRDSIAFQDRINKTYGSVYRITGFFGVSSDLYYLDSDIIY